MQQLSLIQDDITTVDVDAVVNAANSSLLGGGGVDGAIHRAAGPSLLAECRAIVARQGGCETGQAVITGAGDMLARHVIHTVGPVWHDAADHELDELLESCYRRCLELANVQGLATIAFPNISTGVYRFPKERAAGIAIGTVRKTLAVLGSGCSLTNVVFVCFDDENALLYRERLTQSL